MERFIGAHTRARRLAPLDPTLIRERGKFLGFVEAADEKAAIEEVIKVFQITNPEQHERLTARRPM
jgi:hypothetical protein